MSSAHSLPFIKADLAMSIAECPISQLQRPIRSPQFDTIPWSYQPRWQVGYNGHLPSWKGQHFAFTLDKDLLSLQTMLPPGVITVIPLNRKLRLSPSHFGLLMPLN